MHIFVVLLSLSIIQKIHETQNLSVPVLNQEVHLSLAATLSSSLEIIALLLFKIKPAIANVWRFSLALPFQKLQRILVY
jgi:hypothetical protein